MSEFALQVENLVKLYIARGKAPTRAVDGMSFAVPRGIIFGLLGPNGAGKSTLLRIFATLTRPTSGTASVLGFDVVRSPLEVRRRIAAVIQETAAELLLSVRDNLLTYARFRGLERAVALRRAEAVIEVFHLADASSGTCAIRCSICWYLEWASTRSWLSLFRVRRGL